MGTLVKIVTQSLRSDAGDQSFTYTGFGTPQLAIFTLTILATRLGADAGNGTTVRIGYGATDGTTQFAIGIDGWYIDDQDRHLPKTIFDSANVISTHELNRNYLINAAFKEWTTDGVTITIGDREEAYTVTVTCYLFKGLTDVAVGTFSNLAVDTYAQSIGFEPDAIITASSYTALYAVAHIALGFSHWSGSVLTTVAVVHSATTESANYAFYYDSDPLIMAYEDSGGVLFTASPIVYDNFSSSGFDITKSGGTFYFGYIAIKTSDGSWVGFIDVPTGTGDQAYTTPGFEPAFVHGITAGVGVVNEDSDAGGDSRSLTAGSFSIFGFTIQQARGNSMSLEWDETTATTLGRVDGKSSASDIIYTGYWDNGGSYTQWLTASAESIDANGFTLNFSTVVNHATTKIAILCLGVNSEEPLPDEPPIDVYDYAYLIDAPTVQKLMHGSVCYGHVTAVVENNSETIAEHWAGAGSIAGSGDSEALTLSTGQSMISDSTEAGVGTCVIQQNKYGSGGTGTMYYRTAATYAACEVAGWTEYTAPFESLGFVSMKVEL